MTGAEWGPECCCIKNGWCFTAAAAAAAAAENCSCSSAPERDRTERDRERQEQEQCLADDVSKMKNKKSKCADTILFCRGWRCSSLAIFCQFPVLSLFVLCKFLSPCAVVLPSSHRPSLPYLSPFTVLPCPTSVLSPSFPCPASVLPSSFPFPASVLPPSLH